MEEISKDQIELIRTYLKTIKAVVRDVSVYARLYVFDQVILGLLSKAFSVSYGALILIESGHPEEAYGLCRSLVECGLSLRYLTQDTDRAERENRAFKFARYFFKEKQYWIYQVKAWSKDADQLAAIDKYASENDIAPDPKPATQHWSEEQGFLWYCVNLDHPLDGQTNTLRERKIDYALNYHATSAYVHCSLDAIQHYLPSTQYAYEPQFTLLSDEAQTGQKSLFTILSHIHVATRYAMFGMEVENTQSIDEAYSQTLSKLKPIRPRYKPEGQYRRIFW